MQPVQFMNSYTGSGWDGVIFFQSTPNGAGF